MKLPTKLGREPLVDVVFELWFKADTHASNILPGALLSQLQPSPAPRVEQLPMSQMPEAMRRSNPGLRHQPLLSLAWGKFNILIGDESLALGCKLPYPGWAEFKSSILAMVAAATKIGIIKSIERYSLKYVDLIPNDGLDAQVASLNWNIRVGKEELRDSIAAVRIEVPRAEFLHLVNIQTGAVASNQGSPTKGVAVDVDSVFTSPPEIVEDFERDLPSRLESACPG